MDQDKLLEKLDGAIDTLVAGKKAAEDRLSSIEKRIAELGQKAETIETATKEQDQWIEEVEKSVSAARSSQTGDAMLEVIPARHRGLIETFARAGRKDPVYDAAIEGWLKNACKLQMGQFASEHPTLAAEQARLAKVLDSSVTKASMDEAAASTGTAVVPTPLEASILRVIGDNSVVRPLARKIVMTSQLQTLPAISGGVTTYWVANLSDTAITGGEPSLKTITLTSKVGVGYGKFGIDLLADAVVGLTDFFFTLVGESMAADEDKYALEGTAGDPFSGLYTVAGVNAMATTTATATAYPSYAQLLQMTAKGAKKFTRGGSAFIMHPTVYALIVGQTSTSLPVLPANNFGPRGLPEGYEPTPVVNYPCYTTDQILINRTVSDADGSTIYFGPFGKGMIFGDAPGSSLAISEHAAFSSGQIAARVIKRTAIVVGLPAAFTKMTKVKGA